MVAYGNSSIWLCGEKGWFCLLHAVDHSHCRFAGGLVEVCALSLYCSFH